MVLIEHNFILNFFAISFVVSVFFFRFWDVFFKKYGIKGKIYHGWTLFAMAIIHSLIGIFSIAEYFFIPRLYNPIIGISALVFFAIGQIIRNLSIIALGEFHSAQIEIKPDHRLIRIFPYNHIRNPYYLGVIIEVLSTPLILNAYISFLFSLFCYIPILFFRVLLEEQVLRDELSEEYIKYSHQTPRFFPKL